MWEFSWFFFFYLPVQTHNLHQRTTQRTLKNSWFVLRDAILFEMVGLALLALKHYLWSYYWIVKDCRLQEVNDFKFSNSVKIIKKKTTQQKSPLNIAWHDPILTVLQWMIWPFSLPATLVTFYHHFILKIKF